MGKLQKHWIQDLNEKIKIRTTEKQVSVILNGTLLCQLFSKNIKKLILDSDGDKDSLLCPCGKIQQPSPYLGVRCLRGSAPWLKQYCSQNMIQIIYLVWLTYRKAWQTLQAQKVNTMKVHKSTINKHTKDSFCHQTSFFLCLRMHTDYVNFKCL